jgi:hypothetical protein
LSLIEIPYVLGGGAKTIIFDCLATCFSVVFLSN